MKLIFKKSNLLNSLNIVSKAIPNKTTSAILECILFDSNNNIVSLTANDNEMGIETIVEADIISEGKVALNAKLIFDIVRKMDSEDIVMESNENLLTIISCGDSIFKIQGLDGEQFNYLPSIEKNMFISLSQFTLKEVIRQTIFSTLPNDSNKMMGGELIEVNGSTARFVSLDGHRISIRNINMKEEYGKQNVVIPAKSLGEIAKILDADNDKEVKIYFSDNYVVFEYDNTTVLSRIIDGEYFRIDNMISSDYETKFTVNKTKLYNDIDKSMILIRENDHRPIIMDIKDDLVNVRMESSSGSMSSDISCEKQGKDILIAFNPKFIMDALRVIDDEYVDIYMTNSKAPCYIKDENDNYIYIVLPVNFVE